MKDFNVAIQEIRIMLQEAWREGYGKEVGMAPEDVVRMDDFVSEHVDKVLSVYIQVHIAKSLGITDWIKSTEDEE